MGIRLKLIFLSFLQFFVWGSWLTSIGVYLFNTLHFKGIEIGAIFGTLGIASLFMPGLLGILADKYLGAKKIYAVCHILGGISLLYASTVSAPSEMFIAMLINSCFYMPTISLNNSISYELLENSNLSIVKDFPKIRVWGTIGFIAAMWIIDAMGWAPGKNQLYLGSASALLLGLYSFTLPESKVLNTRKKTFMEKTGLDALILFKQKRIAVFLIFSMFISASLQITNLYGQSFLEDFKLNPIFKNTFAINHPGILLSISQISETLFILAIPFFLRRFGIRYVMFFSIMAWVFRFAFFGIGNPGSGFLFLLLSMMVYGMAFDFFNISGSLYMENSTDSSIRASAQGLFMIMTNGLGSIIGSLLSGWVVDSFTEGGLKKWPQIWFSFATYSLILALCFLVFFRHKPSSEEKLVNLQN